jgi:hypothetical protein
MHKKLENYLEEISHFLSGREEREEILAEVRSHILEKAEQDGKPATEATLDKAIAAYGKPRRVADKYVEDRPIIAPAYQRYLFRYTWILFMFHFVFIIFGAIFKRSFSIFPFLYVPGNGLEDLILFLPVAFLTDFGTVALFMYYITWTGKEYRLPWLKFTIDPLEEKPVARFATMIGAGIMAMITIMAQRLYWQFGTLFILVDIDGRALELRSYRPVFAPQPGRLISCAVLVMLAAGTISLFLKLFIRPRRSVRLVNAAADAFTLVMIILILRTPYAGLFAVRIPATLQAWLRTTLVVTLLVIAAFNAYDLVVNVVRLGRRRPAS